MRSVNDFPDHIFSLLEQALRTLRPDLEAVGASPELRDRMGALRSSQLRLVALVPAEGMRLTDLAARVGMTKQALGEFATDLEDRGLLETVRDPADKRVRIVRRTTVGDEVAEVTGRAITEMEARWRTRIGPERWDAMRETLLAVVTQEK